MAKTHWNVQICQAPLNTVVYMIKKIILNVWWSFLGCMWLSQGPVTKISSQTNIQYVFDPCAIHKEKSSLLLSDLHVKCFSFNLSQCLHLTNDVLYLHCIYSNTEDHSNHRFLFLITVVQKTVLPKVPFSSCSVAFDQITRSLSVDEE